MNSSPPGTPGVANGGKTLRLITWNLHGIPVVTASPRLRLSRAADVIIESRSDIVLLQEVWTSSLREHLASKLRPAGYDQPLQSERAGRAGGGGLQCFHRVDSWCRVSKVEFERFRNRAPVWRIWEGDGIARKGYQRFVVEADDGTVLTVLNTHLQARYRRLYAAVRKAQSAELVESLTPQMREGIVLVAGDFNSEPHELESWMTPFGWRDLTSAFRHQKGGFTHRALSGATAWIDYVFCVAPSMPIRSQLSLVTNVARDRPYSDHNAVIVDLIVGPSPSSTTSGT